MDEEKRLDEEHLAWVELDEEHLAWVELEEEHLAWVELDEEQREVHHLRKTWRRQCREECEVQRVQRRAMQREEGMLFKRKRKEEEEPETE